MSNHPEAMQTKTIDTHLPAAIAIEVKDWLMALEELKGALTDLEQYLKAPWWRRIRRKKIARKMVQALYHLTLEFQKGLPVVENKIEMAGPSLFADLLLMEGLDRRLESWLKQYVPDLDKEGLQVFNTEIRGNLRPRQGETLGHWHVRMMAAFEVPRTPQLH